MKTNLWGDTRHENKLVRRHPPWKRLWRRYTPWKLVQEATHAVNTNFGDTRRKNKLEGEPRHENKLARRHTPWKQTCEATYAMKAKATHATHFKSRPRNEQQKTTVKREKPAYLFSGSNRIITGSRNFGCGWDFGSWKSGHRNVRRDRNRNFGHKKRLSDGNVETKTKKGALYLLTYLPLGAWTQNRAITSVEVE